MGSNVFLLLADLTPFVSRFVKVMDTAVASNEQKRQAVIDLVGTVYEGARRTGALDGVKEVRDVPWASLAPLVGLLVDSICSVFGRIGLRTQPPVAGARP
jgi:hypothetical protein